MILATDRFQRPIARHRIIWRCVSPRLPAINHVGNQMRAVRYARRVSSANSPSPDWQGLNTDSPGPKSDGTIPRSEGRQSRAPPVLAHPAFAPGSGDVDLNNGSRTDEVLHVSLSQLRKLTLGNLNASNPYPSVSHFYLECRIVEIPIPCPCLPFGTCSLLQPNTDKDVTLKSRAAASQSRPLRKMSTCPVTQ